MTSGYWSAKVLPDQLPTAEEGEDPEFRGHQKTQRKPKQVENKTALLPCCIPNRDLASLSLSKEDILIFTRKLLAKY